MLRNYLLTARRNLTRNLSTSLINLFGLAIGIAAFLLVFLYIRFELSFDNFHEDSDRIYRLTSFAGLGEKDWGSFVAGNPVTDMNESYTDVEAAIRIQRCGPDRIRLQEREISDFRPTCSTDEFFEIFTAPVEPGASRPLLERPYTIVVDQSMADALGPDLGKVGAIVPLEYDDTVRDFEITGIFQAFPRNSTFDFNALISYATVETTNRCTTCGQEMWAKLTAGADTAAVADRILQHIQETDGRDYVLDIALEPLSQVHFSPLYGANTSDTRYLLILSSIAIAILLIACANYMNLATARASRRMREIGVRKVMGAARGQLARQFLAETLLISLIALPIGLVIMAVSIPIFNDLAQTNVRLAEALTPAFILGIAGVLLVIGLLAGSYPALYLSRFKPVDAVSGRLGSVRSATFFRRSMVVFQFVCTIVLIAGTVLIRTQLQYVQTMDLGFEEEGIVLIRIADQEIAQNGAPLRQEFARLAFVESASAGYGAPGASGYGSSGYIAYPNGRENPSVRLATPIADDHFVETFGLELLEGRNINSDPVAGEEPEALANESAMRALGWEDLSDAQSNPVGGYNVVGIVRDFHYRSAHQPIEPMLISQNRWGTTGTIMLRVRGTQVGSMLDELRAVWETTGSPEPFDYSFLTDEIALTYESERRSARVFSIFAGIAIAIGCLGLFALAAYTAERRRKEIGIRKVMGASVRSIVGLLSREFIALVAVAFLLASPIIWLAANRWLENFAFRVDIGAWLFLTAGLAALLVALAASVLQSGRAALANPADTLRCE